MVIGKGTILINKHYPGRLFEVFEKVQYISGQWTYKVHPLDKAWEWYRVKKLDGPPNGVLRCRRNNKDENSSYFKMIEYNDQSHVLMNFDEIPPKEFNRRGWSVASSIARLLFEAPSKRCEPSQGEGTPNGEAKEKEA